MKIHTVAQVLSLLRANHSQFWMSTYLMIAYLLPIKGKNS